MSWNFDRIIDRRNTQCLSIEACRGQMDIPYSDEEIVRMWVADMDFAAPDCVLQALHARVDHGIFGYTEMFGDALPHAFAAWCERMYGWRFPQEQLCTSHGIVPALFDLIRLRCKPGEKALFFTPSYGPFRRAAVDTGHEYVCSDLIRGEDGVFRIDFDDFAAKAADPAVTVCILCNPHNPTGRIWTDDELRRIGEICLENGLLILSDEIHCDLLRSGRTHTPLAKLFPDSERIVTCMAPSKTFNIAGLQFSTIVIPDPELRAAWKKTHTEGENPFSLTAAQAAYSDGGYAWLMALREYIDGNFAFTADYFAAHAPKVRFQIPESTYLAWVDVSAYTGPQTELRRLFAERAGVIVNDGSMFVRNAEGFLRLNLACPRAIVEKGLSRICRVLNEL